MAQNATLARLGRWVSQHLWVALPLLAVPAVLPFWVNGFPETADGALHILRLLLLDQHIHQGVLYPRWVPELVLGFGYPVFNFYGPATYYLAEAYHLLGLSYQMALTLSFSTLIVLAGVGMYLWARSFFGTRQGWAALVAGTAYMYGPYLLTNVFIRGAIAEVGAQALLPWIFWAIQRLMQAERPATYAVPVALTLAGLAVTHNITLIFVPAVWLVYVLVLWVEAKCDRKRLLWAAAGAGAALALSAIFWLPLLAERQYLSNAAYRIAATYLHENVWTWRESLATTFNYEYSFDIPFRLGLVQAILAAAGLVLAWRKGGQWLFLVGLTILCVLGISSLSLPIWLSFKTLLIVQFPWRLLSILTLPLAMFTGGLLVRWRPSLRQAGLALVVLALIVTANRPRLKWASAVPEDSATMNPAAVAQFETDTGALGTSSAQEFMPRWAGAPVLTPSPDLTTAQADIELLQASAYDLVAKVSAAKAGPLRFTTFYYPGWQVVLDDKESLQPYPSTNMGLLTVDLPPGTHEVRLSWEGTALERWASILSLAALGLAVVFCSRQRPLRWLAGLLFVLFAVALVGMLYKAPLSALQPSEQSAAADGVTFLNYRVERGSDRYVFVYPYWHVQSTPAASFRTRWRLLDSEGRAVSEVISKPYFNSLPASNWPPGTLVDDAYRLTLPPGLAAGSYRLSLQIEPNGVDEGQPDRILGRVDLVAPAPLDRQPTYPLAVRYGQSILLAGYDLGSDQQLAAVGPDRPIVARVNQGLEFELYWKATGSIDENYHGFVHLVDDRGQTLARRDQTAGSFFASSRLWSAEYLQRDRYRLRIPPDATSGLYWPVVGLYSFKTMDRLTAADAQGKQADEYRLPPIKIIGRPPRAPEHRLAGSFGAWADVTGYDLARPAGSIHAGAQLTLTLHYQSTGPTGVDFTRFVQLYSPALGMAAQQDGIPQDGHNPTWSWVPGEQIVEQVPLTVARDARPGRYTLNTGFYDAQNNGTRAPATDGQGRAFPDAQVPVLDIDVVP